MSWLPPLGDHGRRGSGGSDSRAATTHSRSGHCWRAPGMVLCAAGREGEGRMKVRRALTSPAARAATARGIRDRRATARVARRFGVAGASNRASGPPRASRRLTPCGPAVGDGPADPDSMVRRPLSADSTRAGAGTHRGRLLQPLVRWPARRQLRAAARRPVAAPHPPSRQGPARLPQFWEFAMAGSQLARPQVAAERATHTGFPGLRSAGVLAGISGLRLHLPARQPHPRKERQHQREPPEQQHRADAMPGGDAYKVQHGEHRRVERS